jgi:hypothetical protein
MTRDTILRHVRKLETLARRNHGRVPSHKWLGEHGFFSSYTAMLTYPRYFSHLVRAYCK